MSCYIIGKRRLELCDDDGGGSRKVGEFLETRLFFVEVEESSLERHLRASVHRATLDVRHERVECVQTRPLFLNTCRGCDEKYTSSHIFMLCSFKIALMRSRFSPAFVCSSFKSISWISLLVFSRLVIYSSIKSISTIFCDEFLKQGRHSHSQFRRTSSLFVHPSPVS